MGRAVAVEQGLQPIRALAADVDARRDDGGDGNARGVGDAGHHVRESAASASRTGLTLHRASFGSRRHGENGECGGDRGQSETLEHVGILPVELIEHLKESV